MAAMRWKEVMLLGAHADLVNRLDAAVLELRAVGGGEVEQEPALASLREESPVELCRDLFPDLVAAAADAGPDAGPDVATSELFAHEADRPAPPPPTRAAPTPA